MIRNELERFGYTAKIDGFRKTHLVMTIRDPQGKVAKMNYYKNYSSAMGAWYRFCAKNNLQIKPRKKPEPAQIETPKTEETVQVANVIGDTLPITAIVDFNFTNDLNLSLPEWIEDINDRIKRAEFLPSDIKRIRLVPIT